MKLGSHKTFKVMLRSLKSVKWKIGLGHAKLSTILKNGRHLEFYSVSPIDSAKNKPGNQHAKFGASITICTIFVFATPVIIWRMRYV